MSDFFDNNFTVSVVIPTLGGPTLSKTVEYINKGTIRPLEILVCIPETYAHNIIGLKYDNVKILTTNFGGQVQQRAFGFAHAIGKYVLQVDDDLLLHDNCLELLIECIGLRTDVAVSPSLLDIDTNLPSEYMKKPDEKSSIWYKLLLWIVNGSIGYQPGAISKAGVSLGYSSDMRTPYEVEWLPGGCALHLKSNLILENYYPYSGKAYAEDILHSSILRNKGIKLYHCPNAICSLDNRSSQGGNIFSLFTMFLSFSRIMYYFAEFTGKSKFRLTGFLFLHHILLLVSKISKRS